MAALFRSCHPEPTVGVTAVLGLLALTAGAGWRTLLVLAAVGTGQLSIGWDNDALDAARDVRAGRSDKPVAAGAVSAATVRRSSLAALAATVVLSLALGWAAGLANLVCVAAGWTYDRLLKPTPASVVPYLVGFAALPATVPLAVGAAVPWWLVVGGSLLGAAAHFANVVPDVEADLAAGVRGLPQRLGRRVSTAVFAVLLAVASAVLALGPGGGPAGLVVVAVAVVVLALSATAARRAGSRALFRGAVVVALLDVVVLVLRGGALA